MSPFPHLLAPQPPTPNPQPHPPHSIPARLPTDVQLSQRRLRAAQVLHSEALRHCPSVLRVESAAFSLFLETVAEVEARGAAPPVHEPHGRDRDGKDTETLSGLLPTKGADAYFAAMMCLSFSLAKPELHKLRRRVLLGDDKLDLCELVRRAARYGDLTEL